VLYRRYKEELLAGAEEIEAAEAEGIVFRFLVAPHRAVVEGGTLKALECLKVGLGEPDDSGRRRPILIPGSEFLVAADKVLAAVGQEADFTFVPNPEESGLAKWGRIPIGGDTMMSAKDGVFAAGDVVTGPSTVIEAIGAGHRAAEAIHHYIEEGRPFYGVEEEDARPPREYEVPDTQPIAAKRRHHEVLRPKPGHEFIEVEQPLTAADAVAEARRCLRCGPCGDCRICAPTCHRRSIALRVPGGSGATAVIRAPGNVSMDLTDEGATPARLLPETRPGTLTDFHPEEGIAVDLFPMRVRIEETKCRWCGECAEVCPFDAVKMVDGDGDAQVARIEPALCRGCGLCVSRCDTHAIQSAALSPDWWQIRLESLFADAPASGPRVVLACQRRGGALEAGTDVPRTDVQVVRFPCIGQVDAGMILDVVQRGAAEVVVAGCAPERCRFGLGTDRAVSEVEKARSVVGLLGEDPNRVVCDLSGGRCISPETCR
jgi:ferredoxin